MAPAAKTTAATPQAAERPARPSSLVTGPDYRGGCRVRGLQTGADERFASIGGRVERLQAPVAAGLAWRVRRHHQGGYPRVVLEWLMAAALGPAAVAVPVGWTADAVANAARGWFRRFHKADDLSRLVRAAENSSVGLSDAEFRSVRELLEDPGTWRRLGSGSVEDLAAWIASCLPPGKGRTAEDSRTAGMAIARGLLARDRQSRRWTLI
jgi:hypothetical protein